MNKPVYMTAEGLERLQKELRQLITVDRPRVAHRIHEAKLDGDISENAEYEDAKQEQAFLEGRISNESPVGVALMGRKKGDKVQVQAPAGTIEYTVVAVS
jgi:transcription elongation GreA/GreB family factor